MALSLNAESDKASLDEKYSQILHKYLTSEKINEDETTKVAEALKKAGQGLFDLIKSKSFVPEKAKGLYSKKLLEGAGFKKNAGEDLDNDIYLLHPGDQKELSGLVILLPYTTGRSVDLISDAKFFQSKGWACLIVPARKVGDGWNASLDEHRDILGALRQVLLNFRVDPNKVVLTGFSRGGHASWDLGLRRVQHFAAALPRGGTTLHIGSYGKTGGVFLINGKHLSVMAANGENDDKTIVAGNVYAQKMFKKYDYSCKYLEVKGKGHEFVLSNEQKFAFIKDKVRVIWPKEFKKVINRAGPEVHYWLRIDQRVGKAWDPKEAMLLRGNIPKTLIERRKKAWAYVKGKMCFLRGEIKEKKIKITRKNVKSMSVFLNPKMLPADESYQIYVNGLMKHKGQLKLDLKILLEELHKTGDTSRLYWNKIQLN
jgi:dienelactone hydrolase